jgi:DNA-binding transcriptional LysR family regulator
MQGSGDDSFQTREVAADDTVLIFAPGHPFAQAGELTVELVALEPWIQHEPASYLGDAAEKWAQANGVRLWNHAVVNAPEAHKRMVCEGGSVGLFSKAGIEAELALGSLRYAPLPGNHGEQSRFALAWRKDHTLTPLQQAFVEMVVQ